MIVELSFMFIIILGRWLLPKGNVSHSGLSQLLLVYLSLASDILDLLTLFNEKEVYLSLPMVHIVLLIFSLCMFQFALNLTATRGRAFYAEFDDTEIEIHHPTARPTRPISIRKSQSATQRTLFSSSTTRPLATPPMPIRNKPRAATVFENSDAMTRAEVSPLALEVLRPTNTSTHRPSISSINSTLSSFWTSSRSKQTSRKSISESVRIFVRQRSSKLFHSEIWSILVTLSLQDGPFFAIRLVAIFAYHVRSFLTYFFTFKNFLILVFQTYRIASICLEKDEKEKELTEKINTLRRMSIAATHLGVPLNQKI